MEKTMLKKARGGAMAIHYKDGCQKDLINVYLDHPSWRMTSSDPPLEIPLDVQFELINRCNLRCEGCPVNNHTRPPSQLDLSLVKRIIDEAAEIGVCYFTICGIGEASLHPNLFDILHYIRLKKVEPQGNRVLNRMPVILVSNLVWNKQQIQCCLQSPPDILSASLSGLTDDEIKKRRGNLDVNKFVETLKTIYEKRKQFVDGIYPSIHVSTHIYPTEFDDKEAIEAFKDKYSKFSDAIVIKPTILHYYFQPLERFPNKTKDAALEYTSLNGNTFNRKVPCFEPLRRLAIDSDGNAWCGHHNSECFALSGDFLGNVKKQSLMEIWKSETMQKFREEIRNGTFKRVCCQLCGGEIRNWRKEER